MNSCKNVMNRKSILITLLFLGSLFAHVAILNNKFSLVEKKEVVQAKEDKVGVTVTLSSVRSEKRVKEQKRNTTAVKKKIIKKPNKEIKRKVQKEEHQEQTPSPINDQNIPIAPNAIVSSAAPVLETNHDTFAIAEGVDSLQLQEIKNTWLLALRRKIEQNRIYPYRARKLGREGTTTLSVTISADGTVYEPQVIVSSNQKILDNAAVKAIQAIKRVEPIPLELDREVWTLEIPITFNLIK